MAVEGQHGSFRDGAGVRDAASFSRRISRGARVSLPLVLSGRCRSAAHGRGDLAGDGDGLHGITRKMCVARGRSGLGMAEHLALDRQAHPARLSNARERVLQIARYGFSRLTTAAPGFWPATTYGLPSSRGKGAQRAPAAALPQDRPTARSAQGLGGAVGNLMGNRANARRRRSRRDRRVGSARFRAIRLRGRSTRLGPSAAHRRDRRSTAPCWRSARP